MAQFAPAPYEAHEGALPDDSDLHLQQPSICVDFLSHKWKEADVWVTWRNMTRQKNDIANGMRLENASWRTWWKQRNGLKTISPQTLNWLKDSDVTWLYGPLHSAAPAVPKPKVHTTVDKLGIIPPLPKGRKPILKRRTLAEVLVLGLAKSSYIRTPPDELKELDLDAHTPRNPEEQNRLMLLHTKSDTNLLRPAMGRVQQPVALFPSISPRSSSMRSPTLRASDSPRLPDPDIKPERHISFNTFVAQYIAVHPPIVNTTDDESDWAPDDKALSMRTAPAGPGHRPRLSRQNSRSSRTSDRSTERLTIAPIAPTLLKETAGDLSGHGPALVYVPPSDPFDNTSSDEDLPVKTLPRVATPRPREDSGDPGYLDTDVHSPNASNATLPRQATISGSTTPTYTQSETAVKKKSLASDGSASSDHPTLDLDPQSSTVAGEESRGRTLERSPSSSSISDRSRSQTGLDNVSPESSRASSSARASTTECPPRGASLSSDSPEGNDKSRATFEPEASPGFVDKAVGTARGILGSLWSNPSSKVYGEQ